MRPGLHQPAAGRQHQPVLVVERRILDRDRDVAGRQLLVGQGLDDAAHLSVGTLAQHERAKRHTNSCDDFAGVLARLRCFCEPSVTLVTARYGPKRFNLSLAVSCTVAWLLPVTPLRDINKEAAIVP